MPSATPEVTPVAQYESSCPSVVGAILAESTSSASSIQGNELPPEEDVAYIAHYTVVGDELKTPLFYPVGENLEALQHDRETHQEIWDYFTRLIPVDQRASLHGFAIFTDGENNYLAAVNPSYGNPYKWDLNVDVLDSTEKTILTSTLLHEEGHLLTLNANQVDVSVTLYHHPNDQDVYQQEADACPQYFAGEGCSAPDSYINTFFQRFWVYFYDEWQAIDAEQDSQEREERLNEFYSIYQDQFLSDYAPTSPSEDIAESFTFFVLSPKPEKSSIANEKILFFYEYPELIDLRTKILENICAEFQS